jgi:hypothetical protein
MSSGVSNHMKLHLYGDLCASLIFFSGPLAENWEITITCHGTNTLQAMQATDML